MKDLPPPPILELEIDTKSKNFLKTWADDLKEHPLSHFAPEYRAPRLAEDWGVGDKILDKRELSIRYIDVKKYYHEDRFPERPTGMAIADGIKMQFRLDNLISSAGPNLPKLSIRGRKSSEKL